MGPRAGPVSRAWWGARPGRKGPPGSLTGTHPSPTQTTTGRQVDLPSPDRRTEEGGVQVLTTPLRPVPTVTRPGSYLSSDTPLSGLTDEWSRTDTTGCTGSLRRRKDQPVSDPAPGTRDGSTVYRVSNVGSRGPPTTRSPLEGPCTLTSPRPHTSPCPRPRCPCPSRVPQGEDGWSEGGTPEVPV